MCNKLNNIYKISVGEIYFLRLNRDHAVAKNTISSYPALKRHSSHPTLDRFVSSLEACVFSVVISFSSEGQVVLTTEDDGLDNRLDLFAIIVDVPLH